MNGKKARALRKMAPNRLLYRAMKRAATSDRGQNPKFATPRKRKPKDPIAPTWPRTEDQKAQSRPLVLVHPLRHIDPLSPAKARSRRAFRFMHKHKCDTAALNGGL